MSLDYINYLKNLLVSNNYRRFIKEIKNINSPVPDTFLKDYKLSKYIYKEVSSILGDFFRKYHLIKKRVYINKTLSKILKEKNGTYINVYYFLNKYGYIPTIDNYQNFILRHYLYYRVKKQLTPFPKNKAIFFEKHINIPLHSFGVLVDILLTNTNLPEFQKCIIVPFGKKEREIYKEKDLFSWDVFIGIYNLYLNSKAEIKITDFYRFLKGKSTDPTSVNQLLPLKKRLSILSEYIDIKIDKKNIFLDLNLSKPISFFLIPYEFFTVNPKLKIQKKIAYYLMFITQVKYMKKDRKPVRVISILNGAGIDIRKIYRKKGFVYLEEKFWNAYELIEEYIRIKNNTEYSNIETFIETPLILKPTQKYIKIIHQCIKEENLISKLLKIET